MNKEYQLYTRILDPKYRATDQTVLIEEEAGQVTELTTQSIDNYTLYRFEIEDDKNDLFPFFNKNRSAERKIPGLEGLRKFCDYILLAAKDDKLYVLLIEMKSGKPTGAQEQLKASDAFMEFIRLTAERIKDRNGLKEFNSQNIKVKKIIVRPRPKKRSTTNLSGNKYLEFDKDHWVLKNDIFPILKICYSKI